ncbi:hypothetical protein Ancab_012140 [Ancistrocladus abbreviatus]
MQVDILRSQVQGDLEQIQLTARIKRMLQISPSSSTVEEWSVIFHYGVVDVGIRATMCSDGSFNRKGRRVLIANQETRYKCTKAMA